MVAVARPTTDAAGEAEARWMWIRRSGGVAVETAPVRAPTRSQVAKKVFPRRSEPETKVVRTPQ